ncbi:MAG: hypothetical protein R3282_05895, partial [Rhodothermales bacterium]|nr:hypothetical protein [Rhodothermales bacterium]
WTSPDTPGYDAKIDGKRLLLARIRALEWSDLGPLPVVVELNPYVTINESSGALELTHCNLFFRHANGGYVDHLKDWRDKP